MNQDAKNLLLLMSACTHNRDPELAGIAKAVIENSEFYQIRKTLDNYYFLTPEARQLEQYFTNFKIESANFTETLKLLNTAEELLNQFDQLLVKDFQPKTIYHIVPKDCFLKLLQQVKDEFGDKLYDVIRFGNIEQLMMLTLPLMDDLNQLVRFTSTLIHTCPCCYSQINKNITNLTRDNVLDFFDLYTIKNLRVETVPPNFILSQYPEDTIEALLPASTLYCISSKNYHKVIENYTSKQPIHESTSNAQSFDLFDIGVIILIILFFIAIFRMFLDGLPLKIIIIFIVIGVFALWRNIRRLEDILYRDGRWWDWRNWW